MAYANPTLSYPKARSVYTKIIPFLRTDAGTVKAWLPKDSVIIGVHIFQATNAAVGAASVSMGTAGSPSAFIASATLPTTGAPRLNNPDSAAAAGLFTKLTADTPINVTYSVGTSTGGAEGYFVIEYFVPGPGEALDD